MLNFFLIVMYVQKLYCVCNKKKKQPMMTQDKAKSIKEPINYGRFINQFLLDIITSIQQLERIITKYADKNVCYSSK